MGNGATDTVLRSAGQTGVTRLDSLPLMGPVPSSPGHLTAHLINPPPRPAQASFPIHTLWLLELSKTLMRAGLSRHQTLLRRHIVLGMKSKLLDHLAPGPSPGMPRPLTARSPGVGAPTTCPSLSQHGRPARCHAHPLHTPSSAVQVGFHTPRSWPGTATLRGPLTVPADGGVRRAGGRPGRGAGWALPWPRTLRGSSRPDAPAQHPLISLDFPPLLLVSAGVPQLQGNPFAPALSVNPCRSAQRGAGVPGTHRRSGEHVRSPHPPRLSGGVRPTSASR